MFNSYIDFIGKQMTYSKLHNILQSMAPMTPKHYQKNVTRRQHTASKHKFVHLLSNLFTKAIFIVPGHIANFKVTYVRVVPCTCIRDVHKFCSPYSSNFVSLFVKIVLEENYGWHYMKVIFSFCKQNFKLSVKIELLGYVNHQVLSIK